MGYSELLLRYRNAINQSLKSRDVAALKFNIIAYSNIIKDMSSRTSSYKDRAYLNETARRYDIIAAMVTNEGISERVITAIKSGGAELGLGTGAKQEKPVNNPPQQPASSGVSKAVKTTPPTAEPKAPVKAVAIDGANGTGGDGDDWSADMFEKYISATVAIETDTSLGTGFFISKSGLILTNHHVAHNGNQVESNIVVSSGDGKIKQQPVSFIVADKKNDIALLVLDNRTQQTPFIPFVKDYKEVRAGSGIMIIGNGLGFGLAPVVGTVKMPHKDTKKGNLVYTAMTNSGDSGSPLINRHGFCVGIHKSRESEGGGSAARGIAYATAADIILQYIKKWSKEYEIL